MLKYITTLTSVAIFRSSMAGAIFTRPPRRSSLAQFISQYTIPMIVPGVARRATTETIVQSSRREDHGSEFRRSTLQPRHRPFDSPAK